MDTSDYICLTCGKHYAAFSRHDADTAEDKCPHCEGENVLKLNLANIFGFAGGG
jgi:putative FmdB family regulatory protein